jgi:hypothetical protein
MVKSSCFSRIKDPKLRRRYIQCIYRAELRLKRNIFVGNVITRFEEYENALTKIQDLENMKRRLQRKANPMKDGGFYIYQNALGTSKENTE